MKYEIYSYVTLKQNTTATFTTLHCATVSPHPSPPPLGHPRPLLPSRPDKTQYAKTALEGKAELAALDAYKDQADVINADLKKLKKKKEEIGEFTGDIDEDIAKIERDIKAHTKTGG